MPGLVHLALVAQYPSGLLQQRSVHEAAPSGGWQESAAALPGCLGTAASSG